MTDQDHLHTTLDLFYVAQNRKSHIVGQEQRSYPALPTQSSFTSLDMPPHHPTHVQKKHHGDHDLIVGRLEQYIKAYRTGKPEAMMEFYHPDNFIYSDFSADRHGLGHKEVKDTYKKTFSNFHDLEIKTMSVHGHKDFTAWEWEITCKPAVDNDTGARIAKEDAVPKMLVGCTLMWWEGGKIVRNHDYVQTRDV